MLRKILEQQKPYILILDDVWRSFEPKQVGIPKPLVNDGCKLMLTTRSKEVAREMDCRSFQVKTLSSVASLKLFKDSVGGVACSFNKHIEETLMLIVEECDGLPLAIKIVAESMKGISDLHLWHVALTLSQLREGKRNVAGTDQNDAFSQLKFSYDCLDHNIKACFLHCAMYPEDNKIPKDELIEYWIEEELIEMKKTRQAMKEESHYILTKLEENCLVEFVGFDTEYYVRMHDLVRDMTIYITRSNPRFRVKVGISLEKILEEHKWKEDLVKVSLMSKIQEVPSSMPSPSLLRCCSLVIIFQQFQITFSSICLSLRFLIFPIIMV